MDFRVEEISPKDLDKFFEFFSKSLKTQFPEYTKNTIRFFLEVDYRKEYLKSALENGSKILLIAKDQNSTIAGYLLATKSYGGVGFCNWVAVADNSRGLGVGTVLLDKWEKAAIEQGSHVVYLYAVEGNIKFYKKRGFILVGKIPHGFYGVEDYFFYKELQEPKESNFLRDFLKKK